MVESKNDQRRSSSGSNQPAAVCKRKPTNRRTRGRKESAMSDSKRYLAIIFVGGGSSWAYGPTPDQAATDAARILRRDWGHLFDWNEPVPVNLFDTEGFEGFAADHRGVFGTNTVGDDVESKLLETIDIFYRDVPKRA